MIEAIDTAMSNIALALIVVLAIALLGVAFRMIRGPGYADRIVALDMLTGLAVAACALTAVRTGHREFLDVGLGLSLVAFLATISLAGLLERRKEDVQ